MLEAYGRGYICAIALSSDGQTAVVAAASALVGDVRIGKVYIFHFANGHWSVTRRLMIPLL